MYKSVAVLKAQCKRKADKKKKRKKVKRKRKFGVHLISKNFPNPGSPQEEVMSNKDLRRYIQNYLMITPQEVHKNKMKVMNQLLKERIDIDNELHEVFSYLDDMTGNMGEGFAMFIIGNDFYHYNRNTRTFVMDPAWRRVETTEGNITGPNELPFESFQEMDEERFIYSFEIALSDLDVFEGAVKPNLVQRMMRVYPRIRERFPQYLTLPNEFGKKKRNKKSKRKK